MSLDLSKTELEVLVDWINQVNSSSINHTSVTVGIPAPQTGLRNTSIVITALPNSGVTGSKTVTYNRKHISDVIGNRNKTFTQGAAVTTLDLRTIINTEYGINLGVEDIVSETLPVFSQGIPGETLPFTFTIATGSLLYHGSVTLHLRRRDIALGDIILTTELANLL